MSDLPVSVMHKTRGPVRGPNNGCGAYYKQELSKKKLDAAENKHNARVRKLMNKLWCIPVVFGGMNIV
jgi:hypothetical protein